MRFPHYQVLNNTLSKLSGTPIDLSYMDDVYVTLVHNVIADVRYIGGCAGVRVTLSDYETSGSEVNTEVRAEVKENEFQGNAGASIMRVRIEK